MVTHQKAGSAREAVPHRVVEEIVGVKFDARGSVEAKRVPSFVAGALKNGEQGPHGMPGKRV